MKRLVCVLLVLFSFGFAACGGDNTPENENITDESQAEEQIIEGEVFNEAYKVETPYLDFNRSDLWGEDVVVEHVSENDKLVLKFSSTAQSEEIELFSVEFTNGESEGFLIGRISDADEGEVDVYINASTIERKPEWTDEEFDKLNLMQEYVNDIILQLYESDIFTPHTEMK